MKKIGPEFRKVKKTRTAAKAKKSYEKKIVVELVPE